jgi:glycerate-2-kinase
VLALIEDDPKVPQNRVGVFNHVCGTRSDVLNAFEVILKEKGDFTSINIDHNPIHSIGPEAAMDILSQRYNSFTRDAALGKHIIVIPTEIQISVKKGSLGGRNQHLAALIQARLNFDLPFCFVGFATDGVDFLDGVQGAFCNTTNKIMSALDRAKLEHAIKFTSTHNWHAEQKTLITGGKTGHNVSDFAIFVFEKR